MASKPTTDTQTSHIDTLGTFLRLIICLCHLDKKIFSEQLQILFYVSVELKL